MTRRDLCRLAREHAGKHQDMLALVGRVLVYSLALLAIMHASVVWFNDTYTANLSLFILFSVAFELLCRTPMARWRRLCYVVCILGILGFGLLLVRQAMHVEATCKHHPGKPCR